MQINYSVSQLNQGLFLCHKNNDSIKKFTVTENKIHRSNYPEKSLPLLTLNNPQPLSSFKVHQKINLYCLLTYFFPAFPNLTFISR